MVSIIDAFKDFKEGFENNLEISTEEKIKLWEKIYNDKYPLLIKKCKEDYINDGYEWENIAKTMVFNKTKENFPKMIEAYENIKIAIDKINYKVERLFNQKLDINIIIYAGLCNSAGWVDEYDNKKAILYGIDKIAELNWHKMSKIDSLVAHELSHVIHFEIREENNIIDDYEEMSDYGIWRLYVEGFAQFIQNKLIGKEKDPRGIEWINECRKNIKRLKELYLKALYDKEKGTKDFFGDWHKVLEISDVGYYLGQDFIENLNEKYDIYEIVLLELKDVKKELLRYLNT